MLKYILLSAIFFLFFLLPSCKRTHEEGLYFPVPQQLKDACLFSEGSYWVYINDTSGVQDCTYVSGVTVREVKTDILGNSGEYITTPLAGALFSKFGLEGYFGALAYRYPGSPFLANVKKYSICNGMRTVFAVYNDTVYNHEGPHYEMCGIDDHGSAKYDIDKYKQMNLFLSYPVNGNNFDSVFEMRSAFIFPPAYDTISFFFRKYIGIVKVVMKVDTTFFTTGIHYATFSWSLLRYNISKNNK